MIKVEKCCLCVRLSNFAIILGSIYSFLSITLVLIIGSFLLNYDNLIISFYDKGDFDSVRIGTFLEKWKNGMWSVPWHEFVDLIKFYSFDVLVVITIAIIYSSLQALSFISSLSLVCGAIHVRFINLFCFLTCKILSFFCRNVQH